MEMDNLTIPPLTKANLDEHQRNLPEIKLAKAQKRVYDFLSNLNFRLSECTRDSCRIRDAESVYITDDKELGYRGNQEPKPNLDDLDFWERRLFKFETVHRPIVRLESLKSAVVGHILSICQLGRKGYQFLENYEIYLAELKQDINLLCHRSQVPNLESLEYWQYHAKYLQEKYFQIYGQKCGWESDLTNPVRKIQQEPVQPGENFRDDSTSSTSICRLALLGQKKRRQARDRWLGAVSTPENISPPATQLSYSFETNIQSSAGSGAEGLLFLPDPLWYNSKRNRVRSSVRDLLSGLRNHRGEEGRQLAEAAGVYIADNIAHRRGESPNLEADIAIGYINVPVIDRDIAFWEEKETDLANKYRLLSGTSSSSGTRKGSKRRGDQMENNRDRLAVRATKRPRRSARIATARCESPPIGKLEVITATRIQKHRVFEKGSLRIHHQEPHEPQVNERSDAARSNPAPTPQLKAIGDGENHENLEMTEVVACDDQENRSPPNAPRPIRQPNNVIYEGKPGPPRKRKADAAFEQPEATRRTAQSRASRRLCGKPPEFAGI